MQQVSLTIYCSDVYRIRFSCSIYSKLCYYDVAVLDWIYGLFNTRCVWGIICGHIQKPKHANKFRYSDTVDIMRLWVFWCGRELFISVLVLALDAMDSSGEQHLQIDHNIYKRRLDLEGKPIDEPKKEDITIRTKEIEVIWFFNKFLWIVNDLMTLGLIMDIKHSKVTFSRWTIKRMSVVVVMGPQMILKGSFVS